MIEELINVLTETCNNVKNKIKEEKINEAIQKIDYISQTCDELILRDLRSAFKSLEDYIACSNSVDINFLNKIENSFLKNTGLNHSLKTGNINNYDLIAFSYYGLVFVSILKNETTLAERYVIRMFETGSRKVRCELLPEVFEEYFKPLCKSCYDEYYRKLSNKAEFKDYVTQTARGAYSTTIAVGGFIATLAASTIKPLKVSATQVMKKIEKHAGDVWNDGIQSKEWYTESQLMIELENNLDKKCSELAKQMLENSK